MDSKALYRKYRSKRLSEIVGQDHITSLLERALEAGKTAHAYLLTGPRGTGKTSVARILAHEINQLPYTDDSNHLDIIEIDAASNNGVDDVRDLREKALVAPAQAAKKVYIIDEVHMLSKPAFNALLKVIEEPPAHVVFILATTDFDKVPDTIISRTQRYHFSLIDEATVAKHLAFIAQEEGIAIDNDALALIAERGGGSFRDSISLLDQLQHSAEGKTITRADIEQALGLATYDDITRLGSAILARDAQAIITQLQTIEKHGVSPTTIASQLHTWIRSQLASQPYLVTYLDGLMRVSKSHHPDITLLVTVLQGATEELAPPPPKTMATTVRPAANITAPAPKAAATPHKPPQKAPTQTSKSTKDNTAEPSQPTKASKPSKAAQASSSAKPELFDWEAVLQYATEHRTEFIGVQSLLAKSTPQLHGTTLTLYTGNKFNKSKLDSAKNRAILGKILTETGAGGLDIETIPTPPPPKDEQAAKVAAFMGGGEEVNV